MKRVTCTVCGHVADVPREDGAQPDLPTGWTQLLVAQRGQGISGDLLCPPCTTAVRDTLTARKPVPA